MVGRWISFWDGFFSRVMLVSGRVHESHEHEHCLSYCPIFSCSLYSHQSVTRAAEFPGCARFGSTTLCTLKNKRCRSARNFLWTPQAKAENTRIRFEIHRKQTTCNSKSIPSLCMTMTLQQALNIPWCSHLTYPIRIAKKNSVKPRSGLGKLYVLLNWKPSKIPWSLPKCPSTFHLFWG